ncbi:MAG: hypothetical protein OEM49_09500 [Myxococcales bacterium]|nr:hypothetical protein [Myxococcales bacterium]MDH5567499.1 hypothetical protein [Myxococcales bacterium]
MFRPFDVAWLCVLLLLPAGCSRAPLPRLAERPAPSRLAGGARVASIAVRADPDQLSEAQRARLQRHAVTALVRQSALDWLDAGGRLAADGDLALRVEIRTLRLRGSLAARLLGRAAGADQLGAQVWILRDGAVIDGYEVRVASALGGRDWKDPAERLARLAHILGRRVAEGL